MTICNSQKTSNSTLFQSAFSAPSYQCVLVPLGPGDTEIIYLLTYLRAILSTLTMARWSKRNAALPRAINSFSSTVTLLCSYSMQSARQFN